MLYDKQINRSMGYDLGLIQSKEMLIKKHNHIDKHPMFGFTCKSKMWGIVLIISRWELK